MATEQIILDIRAQVADAKQKLKGLEKQIGGVNKEAKQTNELFKKAAVAMGGLFSVAAIAGFAKKVLEVRAEFEKFDAVLTNTLGSAQRASVEFKKIQSFAAETPFSVRELTESFVKLVNQGFKPTSTEMRRLGDLAASTGKSFDQLAEAIIDATVGEFERLKEFGIRAQKSGDQVKFTFKGVETQVKYTSSAIRDYITSLGDLQGVSGSMEKISETLGGKISNLGDSFDSLFNSIGEGAQGPVNNFLNLFIKVINSLEKAQRASNIGPAGFGIFSFLQEITGNKSIISNLDDLQKEVNDFVEAWITQTRAVGQTAGNNLVTVSDQAIEALKREKEELMSMEEEITEEQRIQWLNRIEAIDRSITEITDMRVKEEERLQKELERAEERASKKRLKGIQKKAAFENAQMETANKTAEELIQGITDAIHDEQIEQVNDELEAAERKKKIEKDLREFGIMNQKLSMAEFKEFIEIQKEDSRDLADFKMELEELVKNTKLDIAFNILGAIQNVTDEESGIFKAARLAEATISAIQMTINAYNSASAIPIVGWILGPLAAAAAGAYGASQVAKIAGVTFEEGGFTGKSKLPIRDRYGPIAGLVHEDEFVFNKKTTKELRPLFEDIHSGRIDARGLAALTTRGVIMPIVNNDFNSKVLEREVGKIYQKMQEEKPQRYVEKHGNGIKRVIGNTTYLINQ